MLGLSHIACVHRKREYTYARTVTMKNPDGSETMRTMKLKTPHDETHIVYAAVH